MVSSQNRLRSFSFLAVDHTRNYKNRKDERARKERPGLPGREGVCPLSHPEVQSVRRVPARDQMKGGSVRRWRVSLHVGRWQSPSVTVARAMHQTGCNPTLLTKQMEPIQVLPFPICSPGCAHRKGGLTATLLCPPIGSQVLELLCHWSIFRHHKTNTL